MKEDFNIVDFNEYLAKQLQNDEVRKWFYYFSKYLNEERRNKNNRKKGIRKNKDRRTLPRLSRQDEVQKNRNDS